MERDQRPHIIAFPFPAQGHINPMLQFCKRLASKGLKVTLVTFIDEELTKAMKDSTITVESIYDEENKKVSSMEEYWENMQSRLEKKLTKIIEDQVIMKHGRPISCLLYDSIMPWALDMAQNFGLSGACFFTQPCAVLAIYYNVHQGRLHIPIEKEECVSLDGMPLLECRDLPSYVCDFDKCPSRITLMTGQFSNIKEADWVFFNSFNSLEEEVMNWMATQFSVKLIGPTIPSAYLDKRLKDNIDYGLSLFKPTNNNYIEWLDTKEPRSVVYISFGSLASLSEQQMEELATVVKKSKYNFLWVVRESEENKLPRNFIEDTSEKDMVVTWCVQIQVLSHKSIGCFMTHCGWNSTLEALSLGVPMVAMPQWSDQTTNAKFVSDVWGVGVRLRVNEEGIVTREEIEVCISEVMDGEKGNEIKLNSEKWRKLAKEAVNEDGSSDKNIEEFVDRLKCCSK